VILFSDILTPLTGMNIPFDILKSKGPVIHNPIRSAEGVATVKPLDPSRALPYVGETARDPANEVRGARGGRGIECTEGKKKEKEDSEEGALWSTDPIRSAEDVATVKPLDPDQACPT